MKLLKKLLIRIILLVVVACSVIGGLSIMKTYSTTNDLMMAKVNDQLTLRTSLVEEKMASTIRMIEMLSNNEQVISALSNNAKDQGVINEFTTTLTNNDDLITLISLIDRNGQVLLSDKRNAIEGIDLSERQYLKNAIATGDTVIGEVIISKADQSQVIAICKPIYKNNTYVGSIVSTIKFSLVTDLIKDTKIAEEGYAYIVDVTGDDAGLFTYHPNEDLMMTSKLKDLNVPELDLILEDMIKEESGEGYYTYDGEAKFVKFQKFGNWVLAITANESDLNAAATSIRNLTIIIILIAIAFATVLSYVVVMRMIVKPIKLLELSMAQAGEGDLTHQVSIQTKDEIQHLGDSYNQMLKNQTEILSKVAIISQDLSASAEELTASAEEVNGSASEVSENVNVMMENIMTENREMVVVKTEMHKLNESIDVSDDLTEKSQVACGDALITAQDGRKGVKSSVVSVSNIATSTNEVIETFGELNDHAKKVTGISETIKSIAEQINLLALNASIEAARAGEAGRGFTVVAEEVRKLAEQTTEESENVYRVLNTITKLINEANDNVNNSKGHVDEGEATIKSLDGKFLEIINTFEVLNADINELTDISTNQVKIADDIKDSVDSITGTTETNTSMAQEISASAEEQAAVTESLSQASEETSSMAEQLNGLLERFKF